MEGGACGRREGSVAETNLKKEKERLTNTGNVSDNKATETNAAELAHSQSSDKTALLGGVAMSLFLTAVIKLLEYRLREVPHDRYPDKGSFYYYWVLPRPTLLCGPGSVLGDYTLPTSYPTGALYTMHRRT